MEYGVSGESAFRPVSPFPEPRIQRFAPKISGGAALHNTQEIGKVLFHLGQIHLIEDYEVGFIWIFSASISRRKTGVA